MTDAYSTFSWREFQGNLKATFKEFRKSSEFSDVTLVCGDGVQVEGHKMILASGSDFFRTLLRGHTHQAHPLIYLRGVQSRCFLAIVDYIYRGEATVPQGDLEEFLANAEEFGLQGLKQVAAGEMDKFEGAENETQGDGHENTEELAKPDDGEVSRIESENCENSRRSLNSKLTCVKCDFTARKKSELKVHIEEKHNKGTIFECNLCDFKTLRSNYFEGHKQAKHEGIKYDCNACEYQATTRGNLNRHKLKYHPAGINS